MMNRGLMSLISEALAKEGFRYPVMMVDAPESFDDDAIWLLRAIGVPTEESVDMAFELNRVLSGVKSDEALVGIALSPEEMDYFAPSGLRALYRPEERGWQSAVTAPVNYVPFEIDRILDGLLGEKPFAGLSLSPAWDYFKSSARSKVPVIGAGQGWDLDDTLGHYSMQTVKPHSMQAA